MADHRFDRLLPIARWPTATEAAAMRWFSPIRIGPIEARERTWVPAMVPWRAGTDGEVTDAVLDWYRRFAAGQPGVIVVEATGIGEVKSGPLLRIGDDRYIAGLRRLSQAIREASGGRSRVFVQLIDFLTVRRRPTAEKFFLRHLVVDRALRIRMADHLHAPTMLTIEEENLRAQLLELEDADHRVVLAPRDHESLRRGYRERVTDIALPHIRALPQTLPALFAAAATRVQEAGFDGVELHYAHAYTMASFLSARNDRADSYGGSREARVRLPLEVYDAVRRAVGADFVVGCRMLGDEVIAGGSALVDATYYARRFADAGFDFISVSKGGKFEDARDPRVGESIYPYTGESGRECMPTVKIDERGPFGRNIALAAAIRAAVREGGRNTPVVAAGGIASPWQAEEILRANQADIVASARQSLADPDWFRKIRLGHGDEVRRCFFTNYCEALDQKHREVTCQRWDREEAAEGEIVARSADGKRRLTAPPWRPS